MSHQSSGSEGPSDRPIKKIKITNLSPEKEKNRSQEEKLMFELFNKVFEFAQDYFSIDDETLSESITEIGNKFKSFDYLKTDFDKVQNLCGYFYRHSTLNTALVRHRILNALNSSTGLQAGIHKAEINVISLGGGPGTDILGLCSALEEYSIANYMKKQQIFNITTVDNVKGWLSYSNLIQFFVREGNYGNASAFFRKHNVSLNFMCVDLFSQALPTKYENDLKQADIVLLSRVLDAQNLKEKNPDAILKILIPRMKEDALLLLIDCFPGKYATQGLIEIHKSNLPEFNLAFPQTGKFPRAKSSTANINVFMKITLSN